MAISPLRLRATSVLSPSASVDLHGVDVAVLDGAARAGLDVVFDRAPGGHTAGVEGTHGELRAGLADGLGGDDADGQAFFDDAVGGHVHAVAAWRRRRAGFRR